VIEKAGDMGVRISIPMDYAVAKKPSNTINIQNQQLSGRGSTQNQNHPANSGDIVSNSGDKDAAVMS
jgi:hypothetical protein